MKDQLFLFTGENTFALTEELKRWKEGFIEKHGDTNFQVRTGKDLLWSELLDETCSAPFLSEKRLIIIEGIPSKIDKKDLEVLGKNMHESTIVAFIEASPDKRKSATKFLIKNATVRTFPTLSEKQLASWLLSLAEEYEASVTPQVAAHLISTVGKDQWYLKQEFLKVIAFAESNSPSTADIDAVCLPSQKHTVWKLSDLVGRGQTQEAVQFSKALHDSGEDAFALWNIYLWIMKNISVLWIWEKEKNLPPGALSKEAGIPFPSVQSLLPFVRKMPQEKMRELVESAVSADYALKTGGVKATGTEPVELVTMLEREILRVGSV